MQFLVNKINYNIFLFIIHISFLHNFVQLLEIDNSVADTPDIECLGDSMTVHFRTRAPFEGNVYVKNHFQDVQCKTGRTERNDVSITVAFGNPCGLRRRRNANPVGISLEATIVVMFHPQFLTKVDRAYKIECFYMQADKLVTSSLHVSMITTMAVRQNVEMPICTYQVLDGPVTGNPVRYALIGDMVYHTWSCATSTGADIYCMTIHSCTVDDGLGEIIQLLDHDGCAMDKHILQNLKYQSSMLAYRESHVFKFADKQTLYFNCQVRLELKESGYCQRTSDHCIPLASKKRRYKRAVGGASSRGWANFDVGAPPVGVLEIEDQLELKTNLPSSQTGHQKIFLKRISLKRPQYSTNSSGNLCLSPLTLGFLFSLLVASLMATLSFVTVFCWAKYREKLEKIRMGVRRRDCRW